LSRGLTLLHHATGHDHQVIDPAQAEAVSARALEIGGLTCKSISALIKSHKVSRHTAEPAAVGEHANLRGPGYFH
ncbi:hypothetical protein P7L87_24620, partial [Vibrio parahaemolyticus]|nr:hypothetical protein [Vibrio parahaemolyticus]